MSVYPKQKTTEAVGILLLAGALLLALSLLSYSTLDSSLNVAGPADAFTNWVGKVGAWTADLLLQTLGLPAFLLPFVFLLAGYRKLRGRTGGGAWVELVAIAAGLLALSAGCSLVGPFLPWEFSFEPGGIAGLLVGSALERYFNTAGALVVVLTVLLLSMMLTTGFSLQSLAGSPGARLRGGAAGLSERFASWRQRRRDRRELRRLRQEKAEVMTHMPPSQSSSPAPAPAADPQWEPVVKTGGPELEEWEEVEPEPLEVPEATPPPSYRLPSLDFLQPPAGALEIDEAELLERARRLTAKYAEFDVTGRVLQIHPGPVVTTFEYKPDPGVKYSRITSLVDDLCLGLRAESIRIDRIPGKNTVGVEVPNTERQLICLREILASSAFAQSQSLLTLGLGKQINGSTQVTDLSRMPHLLIAGATGSGKSVALNCFVCSILYKASPADVRFIMIDPKRLELGLYDDIPHLLTPIVTDPKQAANALNWAVREMEGRYKLLARQGVRNLAQYNELIRNTAPEDLAETEEGKPPEPLPLIVVIVDELADLMMTAGKEVEASLTRLAQMARAIGIHLILATQRPSVDVITGLIKANFPSRISFRVSSKIDSRTVLDANGAELLLGQGDMLFLSPRTSRPVRVHGAYVSEKEIARITEFLRAQGEPDYHEEVLDAPEEKETALVEMEDLHDDLYDEAARFVVETGKASTSLLQRRFRVGYGRAARLLDMMEHEGLIGAPDGSKAREVLVAGNYFDEIE